MNILPLFRFIIKHNCLLTDFGINDIQVKLKYDGDGGKIEVTVTKKIIRLRLENDRKRLVEQLEQIRAGNSSEDRS